MTNYQTRQFIYAIDFTRILNQFQFHLWCLLLLHLSLFKTSLDKNVWSSQFLSKEAKLPVFFQKITVKMEWIMPKNTKKFTIYIRKTKFHDWHVLQFVASSRGKNYYSIIFEGQICSLKICGNFLQLKILPGLDFMNLITTYHVTYIHITNKHQLTVYLYIRILFLKKKLHLFLLL